MEDTELVVKNNENGNKLQNCGICLDDLTPETVHQLEHCKCSFCKNCLDRYFQFMIDNGNRRIQCPSFRCLFKEPISFDEINQLISGEHQRKFKEMFNEIENDNNNNNNSGSSRRFQCPYCEQYYGLMAVKLPSSSVTQESINDDNSANLDDHRLRRRSSIELSILKIASLIFKCPKCSKVSCMACRAKLSGQDTDHDCRDLNENIMDEFDIKRCPNCNFLIQREGGCAQISCRNCCHVFCWHCLKSLEKDFLLFHYDSGPCKNKLGHSRISIFLNRAQTVSIFVGIGILMVLASPVIIVLLPCVMTKKCRICRRHKRRNSMT